jgi:hypothetical protein
MDIRQIIGDYDEGLINTSETANKIVSVVLEYLQPKEKT